MEELRYGLEQRCFDADQWGRLSPRFRQFLVSFLYGGCVNLPNVISILDSKHSKVPLKFSKTRESTLSLAPYHRLTI